MREQLKNLIISVKNRNSSQVVDSVKNLLNQKIHNALNKQKEVVQKNFLKDKE